jgi:hypothetical protein
MARRHRCQRRVGHGSPEGEGERSDGTCQRVCGRGAGDAAVGEVVVDHLCEPVKPPDLCGARVVRADQRLELSQELTAGARTDARVGGAGLDRGGQGLRGGGHRSYREPVLPPGGGPRPGGGGPRRGGDGHRRTPGRDFVLVARRRPRTDSRKHDREHGCDRRQHQQGQDGAAGPSTEPAHPEPLRVRGATAAPPTCAARARHLQLWSVSPPVLCP